MYHLATQISWRLFDAEKLIKGFPPKQFHLDATIICSTGPQKSENAKSGEKSILKKSYRWKMDFCRWKILELSRSMAAWKAETNGWIFFSWISDIFDNLFLPTGVNIMITIFGEFHQFSAKNVDFLITTV
jgi:hypothetical protein